MKFKAPISKLPEDEKRMSEEIARAEGSRQPLEILPFLPLPGRGYCMCKKPFILEDGKGNKIAEL